MAKSFILILVLDPVNYGLGWQRLPFSRWSVLPSEVDRHGASVIQLILCLIIRQKNATERSAEAENLPEEKKLRCSVVSDSWQPHEP